MAAGVNLSDYIEWPTTPISDNSDNGPYLKKQTIFIRMIKGDDIEGFSKAFDNGRMRIYKLV